MNNIMNNFVDGVVQCYGCPIFDRLFQIVSTAAASVYKNMVFFAMLIFFILFAFFILNTVWQNLKKGAPDPWYQKSVRPVIINSLVALSFLFMGVGLPRLITTATFEPVAQITLIYTQSMLNINDEVVEEHVTYQPMPMSQDGFFRPELRDKIILLMKTTITQFQSYMKLGLAIIDSTFTLKDLGSQPSGLIGLLIKHIILIFIGIYIFWAFFKLFFRFCCYFADIIVAMALFAFFFPLSLVLIAFRGADNVPSWISNLGKNVGINQFKTLINAIITLSAAVITYTVIMVIVAKFFSSPNMSVETIMESITTDNGNIFDIDLADSNLESLTFMGVVVLAYVINFISSKIPDVTKMVLTAFNVQTENTLSENVANDAMALTSAALKKIKSVGQTIISKGEKKDDKKTDKE